MVINLFPINQVINQQQNSELLNTYPIIEILIACLIAPITEEIVFRMSFKKISNNKWIFALTSGLIFAFVHVITSLLSYHSPLMLIYLLL